MHPGFSVIFLTLLVQLTHAVRAGPGAITTADALVVVDQDEKRQEMTKCTLCVDRIYSDALRSEEHTSELQSL